MTKASVLCNAKTGDSRRFNGERLLRARKSAPPRDCEKEPSNGRESIAPCRNYIYYAVGDLFSFRRRGNLNCADKNYHRHRYFSRETPFNHAQSSKKKRTGENARHTENKNLTAIKLMRAKRSEAAIDAVMYRVRKSPPPFTFYRDFRDEPGVIPNRNRRESEPITPPAYVPPLLYTFSLAN